MTYSGITLALILAGLTAYLLFGGADFGAGLWHLLGRDRKLIEHAMGPLWEANHVWLIFVMVLSWTAYPPVFADIESAYWVPLSIAALGIVARGSALAFRKVVPDRYARTFAVSSLVTPFCLGAVAGAVALGRRPWLDLPSVYAGVLTTGLCVYLAAVYLTWDAHRWDARETAEAARHEGAAGDSGRARVHRVVTAGGGEVARRGEAAAGGEAASPPDGAERFRAYALRAGGVVGVLALAGVPIVAPVSGGHRTGTVFWPLIIVSALAGVVSLALLWRRHYLAVRVTAALAAAAVLWGAMARSDLSLTASAAPDAVQKVVLITLAIGGVLLVPSLTWLYVLFQRDQARDPATGERA